MVEVCGVLSDALLDGLDVAVFSQQQGLVFGVALFGYVHIAVLPRRDRKHIVKVDDRVIFDLDEVKPLLHPAVFFLKG